MSALVYFLQRLFAGPRLALFACFLLCGATGLAFGQPVLTALPNATVVNQNPYASGGDPVWDRCALGRSGSQCEIGRTADILGARFEIEDLPSANNSHYKGYTDWRAPSEQELLDLIDDRLYSFTSTQTISYGFFPNTEAQKWYMTQVRAPNSQYGGWNYYAISHHQPYVSVSSQRLYASTGFYRLVRGGYGFWSEGTRLTLNGMQLGSSGSAGATLLLTASEAGNAFWLALPPGSPAPTAKEVIRGLPSGVGGSTRTGASQRTGVRLTGLTAQTQYDVYVVAINDPYGGIYNLVDVSAVGGPFVVTAHTLTAAGTADNGTVASSDGLVWDTCSLGQGGSACAVGSASLVDWTAAQAAVAAANTAHHKGYNNWRLPTLAELQSLLYGGSSAPWVDTNLFPATRSGGYWSGDQAASSAGVVDFSSALSATVLQTTLQAVRLVRSGTPSASPGTGLTLSQTGTTSVSPTAHQVTATSNRAATLLGVVVPRGAPAPTATQVAAGSGYGGSWWRGSQVVSAGVAGAVTLTGLGPNTDYDAYAVTLDSNMQLSALSGPLPFSTINRYSQSLSFGSAPALAFGGTANVLAAPGTPNSGNAVTYSVSPTSTVCSVNGNTGLVTAISPGTCTVVANLAGSADYDAAAPVSQVVTVDRAAQVISLGTAPSMTYGNPAGGSLLGSSSSGNSLVFTSTTPAVCSVSGATVTALSGGTCTLTVNQPGDTRYLPASQVSLSFTIAKAAQTITPGSTPAVVVGSSASLSGSAPGGAVAFASSTPLVCGVSGAQVTGLATGTCTVTLDQPGDSRYLAALQVTLNITVGKGSQSLQFGTAPSLIAGGSGNVSITPGVSTSPVLLTSLTPTVCTVAGNAVQALVAGTCRVAANQAGDANYNAAAQITQNIVIGSAAQATVNVSSSASGLPLLDSITLSSSGGSGNGAFSYVVTSGTRNCTVLGNTLTATAKGTCQVVAARAGDGYYGVGTSAPLTITVNASYVVQANGMVGNRVAPAGRNALVWDRCMLGGSGGNCNATDPNTGYYFTNELSDALAKVAAANASAHLGYTDWRLPSAEELFSLTDTSFPWSIDPTTSPNAAQVVYWTPTDVGGGLVAIIYFVGPDFYVEPNGSAAANYMQDYPTSPFGGPYGVRMVRDGLAYLTAGTVPLVTQFSVMPTGASTASVSATSDTAGTGYWLAVPQGAAAPTAAQVVAGVAYGNVTPLLGGSGPVAAGSRTTFATAGGAYDMYLAVVDPGLRLSALSGPYALGGAGGSRLMQSLGFSGSAPSVVYGASVAVQAIPATPNAGNAVVYSVPTTGTVCSVDSASGIVTALRVGTCTVAADMAGNASYDAAPQISQAIAVNPASQTITGFNPASPLVFGAAPATLSATGGASGSPVVFATTSAGTLCTVAGSTVTFNGVGTCNLTANQAAGGNYAAALQVTASIVISAAPVGTYTAASPTGQGSITTNFKGGNAACGLIAPAFRTMPTPPAGVTLLHGVFEFTTNNCGAGSTLNFTLTYPQALPPGTRYYKFGPEFGGSTTPHWYVLPGAVISGNQITFSITDNGVGDGDPAVGFISDPGGPGVPSAGANVVGIPTLSEWALLLLAGLMGLFGVKAARRY